MGVLYLAPRITSGDLRAATAATHHNVENVRYVCKRAKGLLHLAPRITSGDLRAATAATRHNVQCAECVICVHGGKGGAEVAGSPWATYIEPQQQLAMSDACMYTSMQAQMYTHPYICIYARTHTHTHTCGRTCTAESAHH
eukprot:1142011-Pelagomonas_calceolata.AAC.3